MSISLVVHERKRTGVKHDVCGLKRRLGDRFLLYYQMTFWMKQSIMNPGSVDCAERKELMPSAPKPGCGPQNEEAAPILIHSSCDAGYVSQARPS
mmetsp:Transcript_1965/g.3986  ORF Transcript_1965/g.3986 Transcript_1965/m.3986 type:complete len:95 (-) Transcript_1965:1178-1462(-)